MSKRWRRVAMLLLALEIAGIAWLVLNPSSATPSGAVYRMSDFVISIGAPAWMASTSGWEYLLNVALFVPLGFLAALIWDQVNLELWVIAGFAVSAALELCQLYVVGTRSATVSDLSANTIGTFLGALAAEVVLTTIARRVKRRQRLAFV